MKSTRCEEVVIQLVIRSYDDAGRPVDEKVTQQLKVFRNAETQNFWEFVDKAVTAALKNQPPAVPLSPAPLAPKKRKS